MYSIEILDGATWRELHGEGTLGRYVKSAKLVQSSNSIGSLTMTVLPTFGHDVKANARVRAKNGRSGEWEFYGRVIEVEPKMESDGTICTEVTCEDALGFLQDTCVWFDSRKKWFEGDNKKWPVEIDEEDESRTMQSSQLAKMIIGQHNNTVGDAWKQVKLGAVDVDADEESTFDAEYEDSSFAMLGDVAEDADFEFRSRYDGQDAYIDMADELGSDAGTFEVGDNCAATALVTSMADVATRMFPYGIDYTKLEKISRKGTKVSGRLDGSAWEPGKGTMMRFACDKSLKCVLTVGKRDKGCAMVVFAKDKLTKANAKKAVVKKYTPSATSSANVKKRYAVPDKAKYVYVYGADSECTTYGYYRNEAGQRVGTNYRTDLGFWKRKLSDSALQKILDKYGMTIGSVVDGSGDRSYYLSKNEDVYGAIEYSEIKDQSLNVDKITNGEKAVYSIDDLSACNKTKAAAFVKWACRKLAKKCTEAVELTVTGYDLAEAGMDCDALKLYDRWRVKNALCGIDHAAEVVRVERDLLEPWNVTVEMGSKVTRASSSTSGGLGGGSAAGTYDDGSDDGDDAEDEYATLMGAAAEEAAQIAVEKAEELDSESYKITVDAQAAGQLATSAYDQVAPITTAMRGLLDDAEEQASRLTSVIDAQSETISLANELARATATYACETEKSVVRWRQTYTADLDAWASDDPAVQKEIAEAYQKLYGGTVTAYTDAEGNTRYRCLDADGNETGPANVGADSAQGHLDAAKAERVTATQAKAEMQAEQVKADSYLAQTKAAEANAQSAYDKAKAAYDKAKKKAKKKAAKRELDTAWTACKAAEAALEGATAKVAAATERCAEASAGFDAACKELEAAEAKVDAAEAEVETAMNGIHERYSSTIEQTAKKVSASVTKTEMDGAIDSAAVTITADAVKSAVSKVDAKGYQTYSDVTQTLNGWTWSIGDIDGLKNYMSFTSTSGTGTLTLGGNSSKVVIGGGNSNRVEIGSDSGLVMYKDGVVFGQMKTLSGEDETTVAGAAFSIGDGSSVDSGKMSASSGVYACMGGGGYGVSLSNSLKTPGRHGVFSQADRTWMIYVDNGSHDKRISYDLRVGGTVYANGTALTSSRHVKENIEPESDAKAARLLDVEVVKYDYKAEYHEDEATRKGWYGVIAEDVHGIFPEAVIDWGVDKTYRDDDGKEKRIYPSIDYSAFTPHLIKLCQMQQKQIDDLTARVAALENGTAGSGAEGE